MPQVTPNTFTKYEDESVNLVFTCSKSGVEPTDPIISSVIPSENISGVNITINSNTTFSIVGTITDVFVKNLQYHDNSDQDISITRWQDLPTSYKGFTKYDAPMVRSKTVTYTINYQGGGSNVVTGTILYSWDSGKASLLAAVLGGTY